MISDVIKANQERDGHHIYGPSSWYRLFNCPGSAFMAAGLEDGPGDQYQYDGNKLHRANALGERVDDLEDQDLLDACSEFSEQFEVIEWFNESRLSYVKGRLLQPDGRPLYHGTADRWGILKDDPSTAILIDWKFGGDPPGEEEARLQLLGYAMAIANQTTVKQVNSYLFAPRIAKDKERHSFEFSLTNISDGLTQFSKAKADAESEDLKLCAGSWCKFCRAKADCPLTKGALQQMRESLEITAENAAESWRQASVITKLMSEVKDRVRAFAVANGTPPGLRWKHNLGNRFIPDINKLWSVLEGFGATADEFLPLATIPVGKSEALFAEKAKKAGAYRTKAEAKRDFDRLVGTDRKADSKTLELEK